MHNATERAEAIFKQAEYLTHEDVFDTRLRPRDIRLIITTLLGGMNDATTALERIADSLDGITDVIAEGQPASSSEKSIGYYFQKASIEAEKIDGGEGTEVVAFSILRQIIDNQFPDAVYPRDVTRFKTSGDMVTELIESIRFHECYPEVDEEQLFDFACDTVNHLVDVDFWEQ